MQFQMCITGIEWCWTSWQWKKWHKMLCIYCRVLLKISRKTCHNNGARSRATELDFYDIFLLCFGTIIYRISKEWPQRRSTTILPCQSRPKRRISDYPRKCWTEALPHILRCSDHWSDSLSPVRGALFRHAENRMSLIGYIIMLTSVMWYRVVRKRVGCYKEYNATPSQNWVWSLGSVRSECFEFHTMPLYSICTNRISSEGMILPPTMFKLILVKTKSGVDVPVFKPSHKQPQVETCDCSRRNSQYGSTLRQQYIDEAEKRADWRNQSIRQG